MCAAVGAAQVPEMQLQATAAEMQVRGGAVGCCAGCVGCYVLLLRLRLAAEMELQTTAVEMQVNGEEGELHASEGGEGLAVQLCCASAMQQFWPTYQLLVCRCVGLGGKRHSSCKSASWQGTRCLAVAFSTHSTRRSCCFEVLLSSVSVP
jgi:hypothetical protein